jgi:hypothetical protein
MVVAMGVLSPRLAEALHAELLTTENAHDRAELLNEVQRAIYDFVKTTIAGGGFDCRDSVERNDLADIGVVTEDYLFKAMIASQEPTS